MYIPFENLPEDSRIWIYQSNRKFTDDEIGEIDLAVNQFVQQWAAHGTSLAASYKIMYNRFIILAVDQEMYSASGCSIDDSVRFIQSLEAKYGVDLLDKMNVTFRNGEFIAHKSLADFKKMAKEKAVSSQTIVFNNLVNTVGEWNDFWEVPAAESWHSRFF
ncbi:ABC transporter ATPase [Flavobacterium longum]|uniref:ABC transporter ATPase n=1 Tax=Flavobacterium longum TaxID=1299340 RepID=UPI0039EC2CEE